MKKITLVVADYLKNNSIFDESAHRDDIYDRFIQLKKVFLQEGYDLSTQDINPIESATAVIYASNMPKVLPDIPQKSYIILSESAFIRPDNYIKANHAYFKRVFTWHDDFVDGNKYIKLNYSHKYPAEINSNINRKLCVLISANKKPPHSQINDLYSKRVEAIRWFEKNQPQDFDLYGMGWSNYAFSSGKLQRLAKRIPTVQALANALFLTPYPSYKGAVDNKKEVMERYKFSICFENAKSIPGYITEKIFDSFFAGCVPIYWGPDNICDHIPKNCFIDMRDFETYSDLYRFISTLSNDEYLQYVDNIRSFLSSSAATQFSSSGFARTIVKYVLGDLNDN